MTLDEAIKELQKAVKACPEISMSRLPTAMGLGIEALKRCKVLAQNSPLWAAKPLPGETEE